MAKTAFTVRLDNVQLTKSQATSLEKEINSVVARHLIKIGGKQDVWGSKLKINPEWYGKWLRKFASIEALKRAGTYKQEKILG